MAIVVDRYELGPIGTNCYVVRSDRGAGDAVVVDPSGDAADIRFELARIGTSCAAILVTHSHWDHILGLADLAEGSGAPVHAPELELAVLQEPNEFFPGLGVALRGCEPDVLLVGGETLDLAGITFEVAHVPGHSPGHLAFYADGNLLSGDVLFAGSVGRTDLPGGDWETLIASISSLVDRYPADTIVHSGHGPETTLGAELERNPFLAELRA